MHANRIPLSDDASVVTALAGTAMSFSHSAEDQAERWLRALRIHGEAGAALQALGVGESALPTDAGEAATTASAPLGGDVVTLIVTRAEEITSAGGGATITTRELLAAALEVYGPLLDDALERRGASRAELQARLAV